MNQYHAWVLARRCEHGIPQASCFALKPVRARAPKSGELQLRVLYFSLDAGMRMRLGRGSYVPAFKRGELIEAGAVATVLASNAPGFAAGDMVSGPLGWCDGATVPAKGWRKLDASIYHKTISPHHAIGLLGVSGMTAWFGLTEIGALKTGETLLISSAAGAVGSMAAAMARLMCKPAQVVGIASRAKLPLIRKNLDVAIAHTGKSEAGLMRAIAQACPDGVDIYFDNVGGVCLNASLPNLRPGGRVVVSGAVSQYGSKQPQGLSAYTRLITHRLRVQGFVVYDFARAFPQAQKQIAQWIARKQLRLPETILQGLAHAPRYYANLLRGQYHGRCVVAL